MATAKKRTKKAVTKAPAKKSSNTAAPKAKKAAKKSKKEPSKGAEVASVAIAGPAAAAPGRRATDNPKADKKLKADKKPKADKNKKHREKLDKAAKGKKADKAGQSGKKAKKAAKASAAAVRAAGEKGKGSVPSSDMVIHPALFAPLTDGERADALRILTNDARLSAMAKVGRYRVISIEPHVVKPPHELAGRRLARVVVYDYAADRSVDACLDLQSATIARLSVSRAQPMLARDEEATAIAIAAGDEQVRSQLSLGDEPLLAMHYWSRNDTSLSFTRRSAAVLFGRPGGSPSLVVVVDLIDNMVCEIVPATQW